MVCTGGNFTLLESDNNYHWNWVPLIIFMDLKSPEKIQTVNGFKIAWKNTNSKWISLFNSNSTLGCNQVRTFSPDPESFQTVRALVSALHYVCLNLLSRWVRYETGWIGFGLLHTLHCPIQEALAVVNAPAYMSFFCTFIRNSAEFLCSNYLPALMQYLLLDRDREVRLHVSENAWMGFKTECTGKRT